MPRRNRNRGAGGRRWGSARKQPPSWEPEDERDLPHRRVRQQRGDRAVPDIPPAPPPLQALMAEAAPRTCGRCREWFADEAGPRGTCDHPGSGFLKPWSDTPACPFFRAMGDGR